MAAQDSHSVDLEAPGDDDPRVESAEVFSPSIDSRGEAWTPWYTWAEDPSTIRCDRRTSCEAYKQNTTLAREAPK